MAAKKKKSTRAQEFKRIGGKLTEVPAGTLKRGKKPAARKKGMLDRLVSGTVGVYKQGVKAEKAKKKKK